MSTKTSSSKKKSSPLPAAATAGGNNPEQVPSTRSAESSTPPTAPPSAAGISRPEEIANVALTNPPENEALNRILRRVNDAHDRESDLILAYAALGAELHDHKEIAGQQWKGTLNLLKWSDDYARRFINIGTAWYMTKDRLTSKLLACLPANIEQLEALSGALDQDELDESPRLNWIWCRTDRVAETTITAIHENQSDGGRLIFREVKPGKLPKELADLKREEIGRASCRERV